MDTHMHHRKDSQFVRVPCKQLGSRMFHAVPGTSPHLAHPCTSCTSLHILTLLIMAYLTNERDSKGVHDHSPSPKLAMKVGLWETGPALLQTPLGHFLGILLNLGMARNILEKKKDRSAKNWERIEAQCHGLRLEHMSTQYNISAEVYRD